MDSIKEIKEGLKSLLDRLEKVENVISLPLDPFKKPFKLTYPENGEKLYCMSGDKSGSFLLNFNETDDDDVALYLNGMLFETREEAEQHLKEQRLLFKIKKWAKEKNDGWVPDWEDTGMDKWSIYFNHGYKGISEFSIRVQEDFLKLPYFKSKEIAQACIDEFGEEIKEVLC